MKNRQLTSFRSQLTLSPVGDLLKRSWRVYKSRFWTLLGIMVIPALVGIFLAFPVLMVGALSAATLRSLGFVPLILFSILGIPVGILFTLWPQLALLYAIKERGKRIGIKQAYLKGWHKIISYFWVSFLVGIITMGGLVLLVIPGVIFAIWFSLATYVLVAEDIGGMNALFRSKQLVSGNWWAVLGRILLLGLIVILLVFPVSLIFEQLNIPLIQNIVSSLIAPFVVVFGFLLYEELKRIKQGVEFRPPKRRTKIGFILGGVIGALLIPGILASVVLISLKKSRGRARDARIIAAMAQLRTQAEIYYAEDRDFSRVRVGDPGISKLASDISDQGGNLVIENNIGQYCAYSKLNAPEVETWYCVDGPGMTAAKITIDPSQPGYCDGITFVCPSEK